MATARRARDRSGRNRVLDLATAPPISPSRSRSACRVHGSSPVIRRAPCSRWRNEKLLARRLDDRVAVSAWRCPPRIEQPDCSVDAVTIAFGIRNVPDRARALAEIGARDAGRRSCGHPRAHRAACRSLRAARTTPCSCPRALARRSPLRRGRVPLPRALESRASRLRVSSPPS